MATAKLAVGAYVDRTRITNAAWNKVMQDWFDNGRIDRRYPCAAARAAVSHLPSDGPEVGAPVRAYERKVC